MKPQPPDDELRSDSFEQAASDVADSRSVDWRALEESGDVAREDLAALQKIAQLHDEQRRLAEDAAKTDSKSRSGVPAAKRAPPAWRSIVIAVGVMLLAAAIVYELVRMAR